MSQSTDQLKLVDVRAPLARALLVVFVLLTFLGGWYATRWYVGNFVAEFAPQIRDENLSEADVEGMKLDTALAAMRLAPNDPLTHLTVAGLKKSKMTPEDLADALKHYEEAVRLSPNDYRLWVSLGRAREQAGDAAGGEKALRRAVELAPAYSDPRWHLGNLLLRAGRGTEAFTELRRAAEADPRLRSQIFNAGWVFYGEDVDAIKDAAGGSAAARAELAVYLTGRARLDDALRMWASLSPEEKKEQRASGEAVMKGLLAAKRYQAAGALFKDINPDAPVVKVGEFVNPGFEEDVDASGENVFGWRVKSVPEAQIAFDATTRRGGARSLRVVFKSPSALPFTNISQLVVVEPSAQYRLEYYVRIQDLKSAGRPFLEVVNGVDEKQVLAASVTLPAGTQDWQLVTIDFQTPSGAEAIRVRVNRATCGAADSVCPIFGIIWYDDFNLQRIGGAVKAREQSERGAR